MDTLDVKKLKRNPTAINKSFKIIGSSTVTKEELYVLIPARYESKNLVVYKDKVRVISVYCIVNGNGDYAVINVPVFAELSPIKISNVDIDGQVYKMLHFEKDSIFIENNTLVRQDSFMYNLFNEFYIQGKIPWFLNYSDVGKIFKSAKKFADSNIGNNIVALDMLTSVICRSTKNSKLYFRQDIKTKEDVLKQEPLFVGLLSIYHSFNNTTNKLVGSYLAEGINSALIDHEEESTNIEDILRA